MNYTRMTIMFEENCDVWYQISCDKFDSDTFSHIVDYPINKVEIDDIYSIHPIYKSETHDGKTLIEIKDRPLFIKLKYIKIIFLKKETSNDGKVILKHCENIPINITEKNQVFELKIHTPLSYISALKRRSTVKFNNHIYSPSECNPFIRVDRTGIFEIDWHLEIIEERRIQYNEKPIHKTNHLRLPDRHYNDLNEYRWLDEINKSLTTGKNIKAENIFYRYRMKEILSGSCFYLSAGYDITPIVALQDKIRTFIYCDKYGSYSNSDYSLEEYLSKIHMQLQNQNFRTIKTIKVKNDVLRFKSHQYPNGYISRLNEAYISFFYKNEKLYCLIYFNWNNSITFQRLYVENLIIPKAMCEILPDGGSLNQFSAIPIPYKFRMPEYSIGHSYSFGKPEEYQLINDSVEYFGISKNTYGNAGSINGINMYKRL